MKIRSLVLPALLALGLLSSAGAAPKRPYYPRAPDLRVQQWIRGEPVTLEGLRGKVVMVDFFQIICPGCEVAHPRIVELQKEFGDDGLQVVGVACAFEHLDHQTPEAIEEYVAKKTFNYPVAIDRDLRDTFDIYGGGGTPYVVLVDRKGRLRVGGFYDGEKVEAFVKALLAESA